LNARNVKPVDTHHQIYEAYGENAMSDGMVRKWFRRSTKVVITCMMSRRVFGHLWSVMIWCAQLKQKFVKIKTVHDFVAVLGFPANFKNCSIRNCDRLFGLSENVLTLGAKDVLQGTRKEAGCHSVDHSHAIQWAR
jgi:hypothetical protein